MKIVITTPLYPPEIAEPAPYIKELTKRLAKKHQIILVIYGHLPEKVPGVSFICIDKRWPLPLRLLYFTFSLWKAVRKADILLAENGPSVEIPAGIVALFTSRPLIIHIGDSNAREKAKENTLLKYVECFAAGRARRIIDKNPLPRPEILPFNPRPQEEINAYEKSWGTHINELENLFSSV
jgi:hypothetical protein